MRCQVGFVRFSGVTIVEIIIRQRTSNGVKICRVGQVQRWKGVIEATETWESFWLRRSVLRLDLAYFLLGARERIVERRDVIQCLGQRQAVARFPAYIMVSADAVGDRDFVGGAKFVVGVIVLVDWLVVAVGEVC